MKDPVSSFYLHVPFCRHLCNYCDFYKSDFLDGENKLKAFEESLLVQWEQLSDLVQTEGLEIAPFETFYLGGGTPSLWRTGPEFLNNFFNEQGLSFAPDSQVTLEVDPASWKEAEIKKWIDWGVNRFSIGVQTLNKDLFPWADRGYKYEENIKTLEFFSKIKNDYSIDFSVDFLLSLPEINTTRNIEEELEAVLAYEPNHLSLYILTVSQHYPHFTQLPSEELTEKEYLKVSSFLQDKGFQHYEVSNFSLPAKESRHNWVYWKGKSYLSLGDSATGQLRNKDKMLRYKWIPKKNKLSKEWLTQEELKLEKLYTSLRSEGWNINRLEPSAQKEMLSWVGSGHAKLNGEKVKMTPQGWLILDHLTSKIL